MGLLTLGEPLTWEQTKKVVDHVKERGIEHFIRTYHRYRHLKGDSLRWGDEIEYIVLKIDKANKRVQVNLRSYELLPILEKDSASKSHWVPEMGNYMVEGTPFRPYGSSPGDFRLVEESMAFRRRYVQEHLGEDEAVITMPAFPRLGMPAFTYPVLVPEPQREGAISASLFYPDDAIYPQHPRYGLITKNVRARRGRKMAINIPIFRDEKTDDPFFVEDPEKFYDEEAKQAAKPNHVYMDALGFGMGLCCLQVTFQAVDIDEARCLYDQLANMCPIMMALSAATPVLRGTLVNIDHRWQVISGAVDDRTVEERGEAPLRTSRFVFPKSRYDSIDSYLSPAGEPYSDLPSFPMEPGLLAKMTGAGVDPILARHIAHLFCRDPLAVYREKLAVSDATDMDHFENIQSTNWQTLRFKPPPAQLHLDNVDDPNVNRIGWRVEFRPMDIQLTDFENAALTVFIVMFTRVILTYRLNFLIPISRVDENVRRAHAVDSISTQKFFFRTNVFTDNSPPEASINVHSSGSHQAAKVQPEEVRIGNENCRIAELTIDEIVNGCDDFPGLVPLCHSFLDTLGCDVETRRKVSSYLDLISGRASGRYKTDARWIRDFIMSHPDYKQDSRVSELIQFDMVEQILAISRNQAIDNTLLPSGAYYQRQPSIRTEGGMNRVSSFSNLAAVANPSNQERLTVEQQNELLDQLIHGLS